MNLATLALGIFRVCKYRRENSIRPHYRKRERERERERRTVVNTRIPYRFEEKSRAIVRALFNSVAVVDVGDANVSICRIVQTEVFC